MIIYLQMLSTDSERDKFELLYHTYRGLMYHVAYRILRHEHDAEDAVHHAFLSIIENFEKISDPKCPKARAFCVIVVERKALDLLRERKRFVPEFSDELYGVEIPMPSDNGLSEALAQLPVKYREALILKHHLGYTTREVANILEMSCSAATKLLWRAKEALIKRMDGDYVR